MTPYPPFLGDYTPKKLISRENFQNVAGMAHEQDELFDAKDNFEEVQKIIIMVVVNELILTIFLHMQIFHLQPLLQQIIIK
jgi:hypothetical protein